MNRFISPALLASLALVAGAATAQKTQDTTTVAPGKEQMQTQQQDPNARGMDDNAQRQHSRDQSSGANKGAAGGATGGDTAKTGATASMSGKQAAPQGGGTRDWSTIDTNHDNLVTPEEMEAGLKQGGTPTAKSAKPAATSGTK
jgi:hypothetical protein